jgi:putative spermidine/putrescine transport system ATP-binding protein
MFRNMSSAPSHSASPQPGGPQPVDDGHPPAIRLRSLRKEFAGRPPVLAVDDIDLDVADGEFFSMLGPSGSGKTTVLRMIAGFEEATRGTVELGGVDNSGRPPHRRDVNTVFQDYALFPHLSVRQNVEYGLRVAKVAKPQRRHRAEQALEQVRLPGLGDRRPDQLSGGQRQRVALARALVNRPRVLLLDEPLGALDLKLREQMQVELKSIQREVGITFLFVTHDQEEALTLSDRVAVFNAGRIEQVGTAAQVYGQPASAFVAGFVGTSNLLRGNASQAVFGRPGTCGIRPERLRAVPVGSSSTGPPTDRTRSARGAVAEVVFAGPVTRLVVDVADGAQLIVLQQNASDAAVPARGAPVDLCWDDADVIVVPDEARPVADQPQPASHQTQPSPDQGVSHA